MAIAPTPPPLGWPTKIAYAFSGMPSLIAQKGIATFLLLYYNQVLGVPAHWVATVLLATSAFDVICDPVVGQISDRFRSRWGRRHPFLYFSVVPLSLAFLALWCPPQGWSHGALAGYLLATLLLVRLFDSFFELPAAALLPELTSDYDERTTVVSLRVMFGLFGGMGMTILAYRVFLPETAHGTGGVLARDGYFGYGLASCLVIAACVLIASLGTHWRIPYLSKPRPSRPGLKALFHEVVATLSNRSFLALISTGILMAIANGTKTALDLYFGLYFWQLSQAQLAGLVGATFFGIVGGVILVRFLARPLGKKHAALWVLSLGIVGNVGPVLGRLVGIMPENGTNALLTVLFIDNIFTYCVATMTSILLSSMMNDVVEDVEVKTGRRSEGLLMAADNLFRKTVTSVGVFLSGLMLTLIQFPVHAERKAVPPETVMKLAYAYIPMAILFGAALFMLTRYRIDRAAHEDNLRQIRARRLEEEATPAAAE